MLCWDIHMLNSVTLCIISLFLVTEFVHLSDEPEYNIWSIYIETEFVHNVMFSTRHSLKPWRPESHKRLSVCLEYRVDKCSSPPGEMWSIIGLRLLILSWCNLTDFFSVCLSLVFHRQWPLFTFLSIHLCCQQLKIKARLMSHLF